MSKHLRNKGDAPAFPVALLVAGYGTAFLGALILNRLGIGVVATGLTFWFGGAVAVLFWGGFWAYSRASNLARSKHLDEIETRQKFAILER